MRASLRSRSLLSTILAVALLAVPAMAFGAVPEYQRVISSRHADAAVASVDGCLLSEVFLGSTGRASPT